jgi:hypothetical protein
MNGALRHVVLMTQWSLSGIYFLIELKGPMEIEKRQRLARKSDVFYTFYRNLYRLIFRTSGSPPIGLRVEF